VDLLAAIGPVYVGLLIVSTVCNWACVCCAFYDMLVVSQGEINSKITDARGAYEVYLIRIIFTYQSMNKGILQ